MTYGYLLFLFKNFLANHQPKGFFIMISLWLIMISLGSMPSEGYLIVEVSFIPRHLLLDRNTRRLVNLF